MKNERRLLPLRKYEITFAGEDEPTCFTADDMTFEAEDNSYYFYSAGNVIRVVSNVCIEQIVVTPLD